LILKNGLWIPAGVFPYGQHDHLTMVAYDYEMMVTPVTNQQYARFLNEALASGELLSLEMLMVEAGEQVWFEEGAAGYYPGDPFNGYKHEEEIRPGELSLYLPIE
jgi:formylglycine-generating enzyme required for sulfatase activity